MAAELFPDPAVRVDGPSTVDIALRKTKDGQLSLQMLNLTNTPYNSNHAASDFVPFTGPMSVTMKVPNKPKSVTWVPDGGLVDWQWSNGVLSVKIPNLHIHDVLVVD